ncbi:unnamed protein product [Alternaria alternata]
MSYDGEPTSENPTATSGPTIFPLLFASVVGRATHAILLWRLEKGERIQILDTLATSTSLTSTVTSQVRLRQVSVLSVLLVAIWALSPIGGQASLRQMSIETVMNRSDSSFQYVVPFKILAFASSTALDVSSLFIAAVLAAWATKASPVDIWGNVKIPKIEHYENTTEPDANGWFDIKIRNENLTAYSSFVGISINGTRSKTEIADYNFHLQTEYLHLTCASVNHTEVKIDSIELPPDALNVTEWDGVIWWSKNDLVNRSRKAHETLEPVSFSYAIPSLYNATKFEGQIRRYEGADIISCSVGSSYVEVEVTCAMNSTCQAVKIRRSQLPQLWPMFTFMELYEGNNMIDFITGLMSSIAGGGTDSESSILNKFLMDPSLKSTSNEGDRRVAWNTTEISDEVWSDRFGQLLNSFWASIYGANTLTGGIDVTTSYFWDGNITFEPSKNDFGIPDSFGNYGWKVERSRRSKVWTSQGNKYEHTEVIMAHKRWAITLSIASLVLIVFSLVPPLAHHILTNGPDIAINFSSLATRNNPHIPIPTSGSFLAASDRFRLLKDLKLRFADAESKSDVGNLVIVAQGIGKAEYSRVRKGRLYE